MTFLVRKHIELDAAHRVPNHDSGCRFLHGHRYRVTVEVEAQGLVRAESGRSDAGMVVDFGILKQLLLTLVHDPFDHRLMLWEKDPILPGLRKAHPAVANSIVLVPCIPTAEALAAYWGGLIHKALEDQLRLRLRTVEVRETPSSFAVWRA